jgi:hypothetical protein
MLSSKDARHMNFVIPVLPSKTTLMIVAMKTGREGQRRRRNWCKVSVRIESATGHSRRRHIGVRQKRAALGRINRPDRLLRICRKCSAASGLNCGRSAIAALGNHQYEVASGTGTARNTRESVARAGV